MQPPPALKTHIDAFADPLALMMGDSKPTWVEMLDLVPALGGILFSAIWALVTSFRRGADDEQSLFLHVAYTATKEMITRCSATQLQWLFPPTDVVYQQQAKAFDMTPRMVELPHGARGNWIGDPDAEHVLVWYHGGGFTLPATDGHLKFFMRLIKSRPDTKPSLSIFFPSYTLAPAKRYPAQLIQAVEVLRHLVTVAKRKPSSIILGGDSAGGNLVAGVLSHLTHEHEAIDELKLGEPLAGAVMMAPWTALHEPHCRLAGYSGGDIVSGEALDGFVGSYMGGMTPDYYTDASQAPAEWFGGLPVQKILVIAGGQEYLLPQIDAWVKKLQAGFGPVELYVADKEAHDAPFVNLMYCFDAPTAQGTKLVDWVEGTIV